MIHFAVALALLLHVLFWGAGAAMLAMPRPWRRWWPVLIVPAGLALQSAIVWGGAMANLRGAQSYAWPGELVPLGLLVLGLWRRGPRFALGEARRFAGLYLLVAVVLGVLVLPLAVASHGLTTISLGSCDAADYAAGARTLLEFARGDREGFLGLAEVVRVHSVDNFFDYWLRLNHFTPPALIALNGAVLDCAPYQLTSLMTMLLLAGSVPIVFWLARAGLRLPRGASGLVAALYGLSPVTWYAIAHVAPGQLLAAQAIALLTWAGVALWRRGGGLGFAAVLFIGYWLVLGSYNFIVLVCLVPPLAWVGGLALRRREIGRGARWLGWMLAPLAFCAVVFAPRALGLAERLTLLRTYDFGWRVPALSPEGWLGFVGQASSLAPLPAAWRWVLSLAAASLIVAAVARRGRLAWRVLSLAVPALLGVGYLQWRGAALGTNASYDAYKLLAVFFPGILAASLVWLPWTARARALRPFVGALATLVVLAHAIALSQNFRALKSPPLRVTTELRDVRKIEAMPDVRSVNLLLPDMWSRLWANAFLLRKPQYFPTHTYEARLNTPLRGEWNLQGPLPTVAPTGAARRTITPRHELVQMVPIAMLRVEFGAGWHAEEFAPASGEQWRWTAGDATLRIENPSSVPMSTVVALDGWSLGERDLSFVSPDGAATPPQRLGAERKKLRFELTVPPGASTLVLRSAQPPAAAPGDPRPLAVCVFGLRLEPTFPW